jgi:predicted transcriptional regulator
MRIPPLTEIEKIRRKLGLTQAELAGLSGVSQSLIARVEAGTVDPRYTKVAGIFEALDSIRDEQIRGADIMTKSVVGVESTASIGYAAEKMRENEVSQMPVFDGERIIGSFSERVFLDFLGRGLDVKDLSKKEVGQHMEEAFPQIRTETPLSVVSALLEHNLGVIVQRQGKVLGIITKADLLKVLRN